MVIVWGSGLYGKVDEVPGLCHVATRFGHLYYVPLIPMGSYIVFEQEGDNFRGKEIGLNGKSIVVAWLRAGLLVSTIVAAIIALATWGKSGSAFTAVFAAASLAAFIASLKVGRKASYHRAQEIADECQLPEEIRVVLDLAYGRVSNDEAEERLEELGAKRDADAEEDRERRRAEAAERRDERIARQAERQEKNAEVREKNAGLFEKRPCPECDRPIRAAATRCKHCGAEVVAA